MGNPGLGVDRVRELAGPLADERGLDDRDRASGRHVLDFAPAYYFTPAAVAVHADNTTIADTETDLDGATIGVCGGCSYDFFLQKTLEVPGYTFDFVIDDAEIVTYDTDSTVVADLAIGDGDRLDAAISSLTVFEGAIADGVPIKVVGEPIFYEPLGGSVRQVIEPRWNISGRSGERDCRRDAQRWNHERVVR